MGGPAAGAEAEVALCFDPAIRGINRRLHPLRRAGDDPWSGNGFALPRRRGGGGQAESDAPPPRPILAVRETYAGRGKAVLPTSVQENVPAWTLFAMFLIVIPVSGLIIKERAQGTLARLRTMPVSASTLLLGNVIVYVLLCLLQFAVMLLIGLLVLPRFGTPRLDMGRSPAALVLVAVASALAATGFGMMVANVARSYDVAAFFSSTFTVIAALLGGIMVPVFLMPPGIQAISRFSPLNWGLDGFLEALPARRRRQRRAPRRAAAHGVLRRDFRGRRGLFQASRVPFLGPPCRAEGAMKGMASPLGYVAQPPPAVHFIQTTATQARAPVPPACSVESRPKTEAIR